jgi:signal peptidase II
MSRPDYRQTLPPLALSVLAIALDQISKAFIVAFWPRNGSYIADVFGNGLLEIYHVRNKAIAFSLGHNLPDTLRPLLFVVVPIGVLVFLMVYYFRSNEFTRPQRWAVAGILGGGIGNLIDRIFRPDGVVDFISVKFFGILGFERWPTFNLADSCVVVFGCILLVTIFAAPANTRGGQKKPPEAA